MTSESAYYESLGIAPGGLDTMRRAYYSGTSADALSQNDLANRFYAEKTGTTGSTNDMRYAYLKSLGGTGSVNDMLQQLYSGAITENPDPDPEPEPGLLAHFDFNDPGDTETFDRVASRRMALTSFQKAPGYNGQALVASASTSVGEVSENLLNTTAFTVAVRQYIDNVTLTGPGGGIRLYAADGTTIVAQLLGRILVTGSPSFNCVASCRFGGVLTSATKNATPPASLIPASWYWLFMQYDGTTLKTYVGDTEWGSVAAPGPPTDEAVRSQVYVSGANAKIDDVRFFDYALDSTKRLQLIGE